MLEQLKIYFIEECNTSTLDFKYKSYPDLSGMTNDQLWFHANEYGYKEQRQIFHDCYYNSLFYDYYLADYRKIVLFHNPYFDWKIYKPTSEYDALIHYINQCDLSYNDVLTDVSYTNPHYSIVAECPSYDYQKFPFAYGAGQWSSGFFGLIVPCKSILKRVYFMYLYDEYEVIEILDKYDFNSSSVRIKLDLYINGSMSDYYVEETLDASKNMLGALFKKKNINGPTISVDYDEIILEENSVISWFCSDLLSQTTNREYTNYPYNPARNRFIMILEPYNTRYVSNPNIDLRTINSDIKMNQYNISLKQNKLNSGNNIQIVDNIISVVGISGVESNFYYVNQLRNDVESSFVEINDLITNITIDTNLSNSVYDLSSSIEALYLDVSNLNMTKQPTINEGDLLIRDTSGLELALSNKQDTISFLSDICLNDLHVHGNIIIDGSFNVNNDLTKIANNFEVAGNLQLGSITDVENAINNAGGVPSITYDAVKEITTFDGSFVVMPQLTIEDDLSVGGDLHVNGDLVVDGTFNFSEVIQNITTVNNEVVFSTQLDVSNQGTGPALKVSQFGVGDDQDVALFNAGDEGDALKIDSCGNMFVYKDMNVSGDINGNEIQVNSIPINSFTNYIMGADYQFGTGWGRGNIITRQGTQLPFCSHSSQFSENSSGVFYCSQPGTYEITANVVYRNINTSNNTGRQNPCIGVGIDSDTNDYNTPYIAPNWNLMPHGQTPFAVQYVRMNEGKVCSLTVKRIHHFVDSTQEVSIHTYGQPATGDEFQKVLAEYHILNSTIQFKYLGNFDNIT